MSSTFVPPQQGIFTGWVGLRSNDMVRFVCAGGLGLRVGDAAAAARWLGRRLGGARRESGGSRRLLGRRLGRKGGRALAVFLL